MTFSTGYNHRLIADRLLCRADDLRDIPISDLTGKEHKNVMRDIRDMIVRFEEHNSAGSDLSRPQEADSNLNWHCETEHYIDAQGKAREMYRLDKNTTVCLVSGYDPVPRMRIIQRLDSLENGSIPAPQAVSYLDAKIKIGQAAREWLRMSDTSSIRMLESIAISEGVSPTFLPKYVDETLTRSLTDLLKDHGATISRNVAYAVMDEIGLTEMMSRTSTKGKNGVSRFRSLTKAGLEYGRNETSPENPRQTQVQLFVDRFPVLLDRVMAHLSKGGAA